MSRGCLFEDTLIPHNVYEETLENCSKELHKRIYSSIHFKRTLLRQNCNSRINYYRKPREGGKKKIFIEEKKDDFDSSAEKRLRFAIAIRAGRFPGKRRQIRDRDARTSNRIITCAIRERPVAFLERRMSGFNDLSTWQPLCTPAHNYPQRTGVIPGVHLENETWISLRLRTRGIPLSFFLVLFSRRVARSIAYLTNINTHIPVNTAIIPAATAAECPKYCLSFELRPTSRHDHRFRYISAS